LQDLESYELLLWLV